MERAGQAENIETEDVLLRRLQESNVENQFVISNIVSVSI